MENFQEVLDYLSTKEWNLKPNWKSEIEKLTSKLANPDIDMNDVRAIKNYTKRFKEPLFFKHELGVYKTGRVYAPYVLLPNIPIAGLYLKDLIIPEKDYVFVSFDFSASQMRHIADYLQLDWLIQWFEEDKDVYEEFAKRIKTDRATAKTIMLLLSFGGGRNAIEEKFEWLEDEIIDNALDLYEQWFQNGDMTFEEKVKLNHTIQRIEVDFFIKKMCYIYSKQNKEFRLHAFIHDEIIMEIHKDHLDHIEKIKKYLEKNKGVKMKVKTTIMHTFQKEK